MSKDDATQIETREPGSRRAGERLKIEHKILLVSMLFGLGFWFTDAILDALFFYDGTLLELLLTAVPPHELYIRLVALALFLGSGLLMSRIAGKRKQAELLRDALSRVRDQVWQMQEEGDLEDVLGVVGDSLREVGVAFRDCGINLVDEVGEAPSVRFYDAVLHTWVDSGPEHGADVVLRIWREGSVAYRTDLNREDVYDEAAQIERTLGHPARSVVDVPFAGGTLAVSSDQPDAFAVSDLAVIKDVSEVLSEGVLRVRDIARLRASEERYRGVAEDMPTLISRFLPSGEITYVNAAYCRYFRKTREELEGTVFLSLIPAADRDTVMANLASLTVATPTQSHEHRVIAPAGEIRWQRWTNRALFDRDGKVFAFQSIGEDISQRRQIEALLQQERDRAQGYLDVAQVILVALDSKGKITLINRRGRELLGREGSALLGADWFELSVRPDERDEVRSVFAQLMAGRVEPVEYYENSIVAAGGSCRLVAWHNTLLRDAEGSVTGTLSSGEDITQRKRAEEALQRQREWLEVTLASIGDAVIATDRSRAIVFMNPVAEALTGWSAEEARAANVGEVFHIVDEQTNEPAENPVRRVLKEGTVVALANHTALISRDGRAIPIADSGAPIRGVDGTVHGVVMVFRDVTDEKQREEDTRRIHSLESLGVLAGGIAHDFNNILTGVTGNLALLTRLLETDSDAHEIAVDARRAADRSTGLTQQLMTFARGGTPVKEIASMETLLREATELALHGSNVKPRYDFAEQLPYVDADPGQIGQVIQNLVLNADQAMPRGGVLKVSAEGVTLADGDPLPLEAGAYVKVSVEDEGIGMSEDVLSKVFDPYFSTKTAGHGLGLAITHSIVRKHDGHIRVSSELEVGTTFVFYLPASRRHTLPESGAEIEPVRSTGRVLLMDDEPIIQQTEGRMLKELGYDVESVCDGDEALRAYESALDEGNPFQVVIMDLTIPGGMGGEEAVSRLHELDPRARVIVSSGYSNDPVMARFAEYGFAGRMAKPVDMDELAAVVSGVLSQAATDAGGDSGDRPVHSGNSCAGA